MFEFGSGQADLLAVALHGGPHLLQIGLVVEDGSAASPLFGLQPASVRLSPPQSADALGLVALDPAVDAHHTAADLGSDLAGRQAVGFEQDHPTAGAIGMALAVAEAFFQGGPLI